jgi:hypothetical protein
MSSPTTKVCPRCNRTKESTGFCKCARNSSGLPLWCKACCAARHAERRASDPEYQKKRKDYNAKLYAENKDVFKERGKSWHERNKPYLRAKQIMKKFGLTQDAYNTKLRDQGWGCGICRCDLRLLDPRHVHTDHCHTTGLVRGIICKSCNHLLGNARDSQEILLAAINYLEKHNGHA